MRKFYLITPIFILALFSLLAVSTPSIANDLDDKIGKYTDDDIQSEHQMGEFNPNVTFKKMDAKSKAKVREKANTRNNPDGSTSSSSSSSKSKDANMNSVVLGPGSNVRGDIIIIDESKGDKFNIGGK